LFDNILILYFTL